MSVTVFSRQLNDEKGTGINTKMKYSIFYWNNNKYSRKIYRSALNLPELAVNEVNSLFAWFREKLKTCVDDNIESTCCFTNQNIEVHCWSEIDKDSENRPIFVESIIYPGENMIYNNKGKNALVKIKSIKVNNDGVLKYTIEYLSGGQEKVPWEYLSRPDTPDIDSIPIQIP